MHDSTLCYLVKGNRVLLGLKKRGFAKGKWNGYGGKKREGETVEETVIREMQEECKVKVSDIEKVAELDCFFQEDRKDWNQKVHVFLARDWQGEPAETEEMVPKWFNHDQLPFDKMWQDDPIWLPQILIGKKAKGRIVFGDDNETIVEHDLHMIE